MLLQRTIHLTFRSRLETMLWTLPTNLRFWPNRLNFGGFFHKLSLDLTPLTFYQPMIDFSGHYVTFIYSTNYRFWLDQPTFGGGFCKLNLDLTSATFYQPMMKFLGHFDPFHIADQLTFSFRSTNFRRWFLQTESICDLSNLVPTYGINGHSDH